MQIIHFQTLLSHMYSILPCAGHAYFLFYKLRNNRRTKLFRSIGILICTVYINEIERFFCTYIVSYYKRVR